MLWVYILSSVIGCTVYLGEVLPLCGYHLREFYVLLDTLRSKYDIRKQWIKYLFFNQEPFRYRCEQKRLFCLSAKYMNEYENMSKSVGPEIAINFLHSISWWQFLYWPYRKILCRRMYEKIFRKSKISARNERQIRSGSHWHIHGDFGTDKWVWDPKLVKN